MRKATGHEGACRRICQQIVRLRGCCQRCRSLRDLECAHIIPVRYVGDPDGVPLRWNPENFWLLCRDCHRGPDGVDKNDRTRAELMEQTIGWDRYDELVRSKTTGRRPWRKTDWSRERDRLRSLLANAGSIDREVF